MTTRVAIDGDGDSHTMNVDLMPEHRLLGQQKRQVTDLVAASDWPLGPQALPVLWSHIPGSAIVSNT